MEEEISEIDAVNVYLNYNIIELLSALLFIQSVQTLKQGIPGKNKTEQEKIKVIDEISQDFDKELDQIRADILSAFRKSKRNRGIFERITKKLKAKVGIAGIIPYAQLETK